MKAIAFKEQVIKQLDKLIIEHGNVELLDQMSNNFNIVEFNFLAEEPDEEIVANIQISFL